MVKFHAWHVLELDFIERAFPGVPWTFVFGSRAPSGEIERLAVRWLDAPYTALRARAIASALPLRRRAGCTSADREQ